MRMTSSMESLPIISALASSDKPLEKAQICVDNYNQANKRRKIDGESKNTQHHWTTQLMQIICSQEPVVEGTNLTFIPKISLLPVDVQRNILAFLVHHITDLSTDNLKYMLPTLRLLQNKDEWCDFHIATLLNHLNSNSRQCQSLKKQIPAKYISCHQKVSPTSQESFNSLHVCRELFKRDNNDAPGSSSEVADRCNLHFDWFKFCVQDAEVKNVTNEKTLQEDEHSGSDHREERDIELTNQQEDQRKQAHDDQELTRTISTCDVMEMNELANLDTASTAEQIGSGDGISNEGTEEGNAQNLPINQSVSQDPSKEEKSKPNVIEIDETLKRNLDLLKNELHVCPTGSVLSAKAQEACRQILHCPSEIAESLWNHLCISEVPLAGLECLCQFVTQMIGPAELSNTAASIMASSCFYKKLIDTGDTVPRVLSSTMFSFTKAFPKPGIGVLFSLVTRQDATSSHCDLAAKMSKDVLDSEHRIYFLNGLLQCKELQWGEQHTGLVQSILNTKPTLDQKSLSTLVTSLVQPGMVHHSCKKFAKLMLFIINQYGKQMNTADVRSMQSLVATNQTFLKKAALNALKKFSPTSS
ncbi:uncharacterized protein [Amphiura filiformis]|uniref:uncharacterized protein n=1 Tax=Amphiura filiformis TaxID=82378 RepID=UPI003B20DB2B